MSRVRRHANSVPAVWSALSTGSATRYPNRRVEEAKYATEHVAARLS
jgi:hypothetical protein